MTSRTVSATTKALARAQLDQAAAQPECTVDVRMVHGQVHDQWGCRLGRDTAAHALQTVTWSALGGLDLCPECAPRIADGSHASPPLLAVFGLLAVGDVIRAARRFAAAPGAPGAVGRGVVLARRLNEAAARVLRAAAAHPDLLGDVCTQLETRIAEASAALTPARQSGPRRQAVLTRVADELIPRALRPWVTLETGRVLIGVVDHRRTGKKVQEVIDVCTAASVDGAVLLDCPRYVLDYLNRYYRDGASANPTMLTVDAAGLDDAVVATAAALWTPHVPGPLMDLAAAVRAARGVVTTPDGSAAA